MSVFYDKVLKMRKNGRSLVETKKIKAPKPVQKPETERKKPVEKAAIKDDKSAGRKS